jgi:hypothetical protein
MSNPFNLQPFGLVTCELHIEWSRAEFSGKLILVRRHEDAESQITLVTFFSWLVMKHT